MPSSNRSSHYHRFIPSEEVQQVSAWEFAPVDAPTTPPPAPEPESEEAASLVPTELLEEARQQAYAEGFEHGRLAGAQATRDQLEAPIRRQAAEISQRLGQMLQQAQTELSQLEDGLAAQLLELACDIARQVVRRELAQSMDPIKAVVHEALRLATEDHRPVTLRLHPADLAEVQADLREVLESQSIKLVADAHLTPGGCVVESTQGVVDGTVEKRWQRAVANLGLNPPWVAPEGVPHD